jgi:ABC-2 type transport system ATP-binding protein
MTFEVTITGLRFQFATKAVLNNLSMTLHPGITWLRGRNGSGKTTLLKLLAGVLQPIAGSVRIADIDQHAEPLRYRSQCFYSGGDSPDMPWLTVREFLDLHMALYPSAHPHRLNGHLHALKVLDTLEQALPTLSLGQHKKVQLALALTLPVKLLLLDEPFNGLDAAAVGYLNAQLGSLVEGRGVCVLLTSHSLPDVPISSNWLIDSF